MRRLLLTACLLAAVSGCQRRAREIPTVNLPAALQQCGYFSRAGEGSCAWCACIDLLRWQHQDYHAAQLRGHFAGGADIGDLDRAFEACGIRYAQTLTCDERFLQLACDTRRGCAISVTLLDDTGRTITDQQGNAEYHCVDIVYLDQNVAGILDVNSLGHVYYVNRRELLANWRSVPDSFAITPVYTPAPPLATSH